MNNRQRVVLVAALCSVGVALPFYFLRYYHAEQTQGGLPTPEQLYGPAAPNPNSMVIPLSAARRPESPRDNPQRSAEFDYGLSATPNSGTAWVPPPDPAAPETADDILQRYVQSQSPPPDGIYARRLTNPTLAMLLGLWLPGGLLISAAFVAAGNWRNPAARAGVQKLDNEDATHEIRETEGRKPRDLDVLAKLDKANARRQILMLLTLIIYPLLIVWDMPSVLSVLRYRFPRWLFGYYAIFTIGALGHTRCNVARFW